MSIDETEWFHRGELVKSNVFGLAYGVPGRIIGLAQAQYGEWIRFVVELETGQRVTIPANHLIKMERR